MADEYEKAFCATFIVAIEGAAGRVEQAFRPAVCRCRLAASAPEVEK